MKQLIAIISAVLSLTLASVTFAADESFQASIRILAALQVSEQSALSFPDTEASATSQTVTIAPSDSGAATFNITGEANSSVTTSIVESSLTMTSGATDISVNNFTFGGGVDGSGNGTLNASGELNGAAVGATANIPANPEAATYAGTLTFRVVYN